MSLISNKDFIYPDVWFDFMVLRNEEEIKFFIDSVEEVAIIKKSLER